jgi:hypothetical protein
MVMIRLSENAISQAPLPKPWCRLINLVIVADFQVSLSPITLPPPILPSPTMYVCTSFDSLIIPLLVILSHVSKSGGYDQWIDQRRFSGFRLYYQQKQHCRFARS